jgi:hypothetical protein
MLNSIARKWLVAVGATLAAAAFTTQGIWAAGDWTPSFPEPSKEKPKPKAKEDPKDGQKASKKDVKKDGQKGSSLDQDQIYGLGYWQAKNGHYDAALATLRSAHNQDDPRVQTMVGFTLRKLGRVDEAFGYYFKAIATRQAVSRRGLSADRRSGAGQGTAGGDRQTLRHGLRGLHDPGRGDRQVRA